MKIICNLKVVDKHFSFVTRNIIPFLCLYLILSNIQLFNYQSFFLLHLDIGKAGEDTTIKKNENEKEIRM